MIAFPNAKINLGLNVLYKRPDGYHQIDSCFYPIDWCDILEITPSDKVILEITGLAIDADVESNLCMKAYRLLATEYNLPPVRIHLHKVIPMGGGLGGGSADATCTIQLLDALFSLQLSISEKQRLSSLIGSDCPFFVENNPALVSGRGEILASHSPILKNLFIVVVNPHLHISTKEAYGGIIPQIPAKNCAEILSMPLQEWKHYLKNDFEISAFRKFPILAQIKEGMYRQGAIYASMTGSGSSIYGIFEQQPNIAFPKEYAVWTGIGK